MSDILSQKDARIAELEAKVAALEGKLLDANRQLEWFRRQMFGRKSEKHLPLDPAALEPTLFDEPLSEEEQARLDAEIAKDNERVEKAVSVKEHERKLRRTAIDTSRLEVRENHVWPEVDRMEDYVEMEPEVTDRLAMVPARMYIERTIRHKLVLKSSLQVKDPDRRAFEIAPLPDAPVQKCMAGATVLADIVIEKFMYHMPFYRVMQKYREMGVSISDSTMGDWYAAVCEKLKLLHDRLRESILDTDYIQVDESTLPVIDNEKHKAVKGYVWCVRAVMTGDVYFFYDLGSRSTRTALKLLKDYRGAIQSDGYNVYEHFEGMEGKLMLGCWAHARRKFVEAMQEDRRLASEALVYINALYHVEHEADNLDENDGAPDYARRARMRKESAYPEILKFEQWMLATFSKVYEKSAIGKAISYTYALLPKLSRYVNDGRYRIDDNLVENAVRPLAIGRKNYLFCGSDESAVRASIVYSLISTCKSHGVDPRAWMEDVLPKIPLFEREHRDMAELLPANWKQSH